MTYAKAIIGAVVTGLGVLLTGLDDGALSGQEIGTAVVALLVALAAIWRVPNRTAPAETTGGEHRDG